MLVALNRNWRCLCSWLKESLGSSNWSPEAWILGGNYGVYYLVVDKEVFFFFEIRKVCFAVASVCCEDALELRLYFFVDPVFLRSRRDRGLPIVYI